MQNEPFDQHERVVREALAGLDDEWAAFDLNEITLDGQKADAREALSILQHVFDRGRLRLYMEDRLEFCDWFEHQMREAMAESSVAAHLAWRALEEREAA